MPTTNTLLQRTHGGQAELWSYSTSHSKLVLQLRHDDVGTVDVIMEDVYAIWGPVAWSSAFLTVSEHPESRDIIVRDSSAGFLVTCGLVRVELTTG